MAWFDNDNNADTPTPVTAERILRVIKDELKFQGNEEDEGKFYCYVNGIPVRFDASSVPFAFYINGSMFEHTLPAERYDEALTWVTTFNMQTHFIHGYVNKNSDSGEVMVCADAPVLVEAGMTDQQLQNSMEHALTGLIVWGTEYCKHFNLPLDTGEEQ